MRYGLNGKLYGISDGLYIINPANGATTKVGDFNYQGMTLILMCSAAVSPIGSLYVLENAQPARLFAVNLSTAALTLMGTCVESIVDIDFSPGGTLYGIFAELCILNPSTAIKISTVNSLMAEWVVKMSFGSGGTLYGVNLSDNTLYSISTTTGSLTPIATNAAGLIGFLGAFVAEHSASVYPEIQPYDLERALATPTPGRTVQDLLQLKERINAVRLQKREAYRRTSEDSRN